MNFNATSLTVGLLAGLAAALLCISAGEPNVLSLFLFAAATLPILIASLGWSNAAGFVAAAVAGGIVSLFVSPLAALVFTVTTLAPAAWVGHLANLGRPAEELGGPTGAMAWFPLSDILLQLSVMVVAGLIVTGIAIGYGPELIDDVATRFFEVLAQQNADLQLTDADRDGYAAFFLAALPVVQGALWVLILFTAYYVAHWIVRLSGRARRPKDDIPASLRLSRRSLFLFGAGLLLTFAGGMATPIGGLICGAFGAGFILAGFAVFHHRTRGKPWRGFALWGAYMLVIFFTLPLLFFLIAGMVETARTVPVSRPPPQD
jgi:hypothetical protein